MVRACSTAALLAAGFAGGAVAQDSPIGKTISGEVRVCLRMGCLPPVKAQVYVSNARRVFD